jgi:hypothetical protein
MKKIIISEEQAKKLIGKVVNENEEGGMEMFGEKPKEYNMGDGSKGEKTSWYCMETDNGGRGIRHHVHNIDEAAPEAQAFIGKGGVTKASGPYTTRVDAANNCQVVKIPSIIPYSANFENHSAALKLPPGSDFVKKLAEFFKAGGKLKNFRIESSASNVPAEFVEGDEKKGKWKDNKQYDMAVEGDNDDGTGNLQLSKARAYNLYVALLTMFPQLKSLDHKLIAHGATGPEYARGMDQNDPSFHNHKKVDLIFNQL